MKHLLPFLLLLAALPAAAQSLGPALGAQTAAHAGSGKNAAPDETPLSVVIYTRDAAGLEKAGVSIGARFDGFVTARLAATDVARVAALPGVAQIDSPVLFAHNDVAAALTGAQALRSGLVGGTSYTGAGVLVCIIDSGIDWRHGDFRNPANPLQSRIHSVWDQTLVPVAGEAFPAGFTYGVAYSRAQIEAGLAGGPAPRTADTYGHGTHVAGTAAGNGASLSPARNVGMAPGAELVVVKSGEGVFPISNIIDGLQYCSDVAAAEGKPVVANLSLGADDGPHDGTDAKSVAIDAFAALPGHAVVQSAGNSGGALIHRRASVGAGSSTSLTFTLPAYTATAGAGNDDFSADVWFDAAPGVTATLTSPGGQTVTQLAGTAQTVQTPDGTVFLYNDVSGASRRIYFVVRDDNAAITPAPGTWTLTLANLSGTAEGFHAWLFDAMLGGADVVFGGADSDYTVSNAAAGGITVGAYAHRWRYASSMGGTFWYGSADASDARSPFSSRGPSRAGAILPHLSAPGQAMISTLSSTSAAPSDNVVAGGKHVVMQGTSMSSPVVAGLAALLLQQQPGLTGAQVRTLLQSTADVDAFTGAVPNNLYGAGKVNAYTAMARLVNGASTAALRTISYDGAITGVSSLASAQAAAVRFVQPWTHDARIRGVLFHPATTVPAAGTLTFGIYDDNAGQPGALVGTPVTLDAARLQMYTWNYLDLTGANADLLPGAEYHVVVRADALTGTLAMAHDGATTTGRSTKQTGGTWTPQLFDWAIRPVVTGGAGALPVELAFFEGVAQGEAAVLRWTTAGETNNAGFAVEGRPAEAAAWRLLGWVEGHGTTSEASRYQFETPALAPGRHLFRLRQTDSDGAVSYSETVEVGVGAPTALALFLDGPNPVRGRLAARFVVPRSGSARVEVYDAVGRRVGVLFSGEARAGEVYPVALDGAALASGLYVVRLAQGGQQQTRTVVVAR